MKPPVTNLRIIAALALAILLAPSLLTPPDSAAESRGSHCRKETGTAYPGGKGSPYFQGIPNAESYEPVTDTSGRRAVVRDLIEVFNMSTAGCSWRVVSKDKDWVSLNTESGTVRPEKHDTIRVSINSRAQSLRPGIYKARIKFQLGPDTDKWNAYAIVILEILDECFIKVRDANRMDIADGGRVATWEGTIGRPMAAPAEAQATLPLPSPNRPRTADSQAAGLLKSLAQQERQGIAPISVPAIASAQRHATPSGYQHWTVTMNNSSLLEVNPIPPSDPNERWLWAVIHAPDSGRTLLAQGMVCQAFYEACHANQTAPAA